MIRLIGNLPDNVLAITATGRVTSDDYQTVVAPAADARRAAHDTLRLLYHLPPAFKKFTTTALWDDAQIGLQRLHGFERVAIVTDVDWLKTLADGLHLSGSAEVRVFAHAELDEARDWICA
jgi:hypothetical protein